MRIQRLGPLFVFVFLFSAFSIQARQSSMPPAPTRDSQALSILGQALNAGGGLQAVTAIQDFTASGNITYFWADQPVQGSATVKALGITNFRLDSNMPTGTDSWVASKSAGSEKTTDGKISDLVWTNQVKRLSVTFPLALVASAVNNASVQVTYSGQTSYLGHSAYDVCIQQVLPSVVDPKGTTSARTAQDFLVDSSTFVILGLRDQLYGESSRQVSLAHEIQFSNYQSENGVQVPFGVSEFIDGQHTWTLQLSSISFNTGLTSSDFVLQ
jgi:hypothetical protein